jgi:Maltogenic Amylase, C-terminal domain
VAGGELKRITTNDSSNFFAFTREKNGDKVLCVYNFTNVKSKIQLQGNYKGTYINAMTGEKYELKDGQVLILDPWGYLILSNK